MTGMPYAEWLKLEGAVRSANRQQEMIREAIALAERTLVAMTSPAPDAGSQGPTDERADAGR